MNDLHFVLEHLFKKYPQSNFYLSGSSFGACIGIRYITQFDHGHRVKGMVSLSNPFDILKSAQMLNTWRFCLYGKFMVKNLVKKVHHNKTAIEKWIEENKSDLDFEHLSKIKSTFEFDNYFTFRVNKSYKNIDDYYHDISCEQFVSKIQIPVLFLQAKNDPISQFFKND